ADIQARPAQALALFDHADLHAELRAAYRADISPRPRANHDHVICPGHEINPLLWFEKSQFRLTHILAGPGYIKRELQPDPVRFEPLTRFRANQSRAGPHDFE